MIHTIQPDIFGKKNKTCIMRKSKFNAKAIKNRLIKTILYCFRICLLTANTPIIPIYANTSCKSNMRAGQNFILEYKHQSANKENPRIYFPSFYIHDDIPSSVSLI